MNSRSERNSVSLRNSFNFWDTKGSRFKASHLEVQALHTNVSHLTVLLLWELQGFHCTGFGQSWISNQFCFWSSLASECLRDDKQRTSIKHCCLQTSFGYHAWTGNSCCLSGKGIICTKSWLLSLVSSVPQTVLPIWETSKKDILKSCLWETFYSILLKAWGSLIFGLFSWSHLHYFAAFKVLTGLIETEELKLTVMFWEILNLICRPVNGAGGTAGEDLL